MAADTDEPGLDPHEEKYVEAVRDLYPGSSPTGGVKVTELADYLDQSSYGWVGEMCRRLADDGHLGTRGGLRGTTYVPPDDAEG